MNKKGRVVDILMNSEKKYDILCPHFSICSGCQYNTEVDRIPLVDDARSFFKEKGVNDVSLHLGAPTEWRYRAKLPVRGTPKNPIIGLYEKKTHRAVDIPLCRVHHAAINRAVDHVKSWMLENAISPYCEKTGTGLLRYLQLTVERETGLVQLVLVINQDIGNIGDFQSKCVSLSTSGMSWHSIWINGNRRRDNVILGEEWTLVSGLPWLITTFCGRLAYFHPASFFQANVNLYEELLVKIQNSVIPKSSILEYYAGAGIIGIVLLENSHSIKCVEIVPKAKECFIESQKQFSDNEKQKIEFHLGASSNHLHLLKYPTDVVIVDPPRKGLEKSLLEALCGAKHLKQLVYVSCGWESFKKDCQELTNAGWQLSNADLFLFFPGSDHLETLALFRF